MAAAIIAGGGRIHLEKPVERVVVEAGKAAGIATVDGSVYPCDHVVSTMPLTLMVRSIRGAPEEVVAATGRLKFRNTILVYLRVAKTNVFSDQWLYVHSPELRVGRVTNFRNWVPELYGASPSSILALEYWCNDDDALWAEDDDLLVRRATREIAGTGLVDAADVVDGKVVRVHRCYPVYTRDYKDALAPVVEFLRSIGNLSAVGRYGSFKYNNQDHSILMGILAADNIASGARHDLWQVNSDDTYQEQASITDQGLVAGQGR
jgi:protoporphyrinogen oxidase